jgi:hypothetical protein
MDNKKPKKESNKWVLFVKEIQKINNVKYFEALKIAAPIWKKKKEEENDKSTQTDTDNVEQSTEDVKE